MSQANVSDFFKCLKTDEVLQRQLKGANKSSNAIKIAPEDLIRTASDKGYEFNAEELQSYIKESKAKGNGNEELSMEELEAVAGGVVIIIIC
jgi:predicted ribosomally synthesized peptide with nif11-like leader